MKKLKINTLKEKLEVLTREQLKFVMGGDGGDESCQQHGSWCNTSQTFNCCSGLHCVVGSSGDNICLHATL